MHILSELPGQPDAVDAWTNCTPVLNLTSPPFDAILMIPPVFALGMSLS